MDKDETILKKNFANKMESNLGVPQRNNEKTVYTNSEFNVLLTGNAAVNNLSNIELKGDSINRNKSDSAEMGLIKSSNITNLITDTNKQVHVKKRCDTELFNKKLAQTNFVSKIPPLKCLSVINILSSIRLSSSKYTREVKTNQHENQESNTQQNYKSIKTLITENLTKPVVHKSRSPQDIARLENENKPSLRQTSVKQEIMRRSSSTPPKSKIKPSKQYRSSSISFNSINKPNNITKQELKNNVPNTSLPTESVNSGNSKLSSKSPIEKTNRPISQKSARTIAVRKSTAGSPQNQKEIKNNLTKVAPKTSPQIQNNTVAKVNLVDQNSKNKPTSFLKDNMKNTTENQPTTKTNDKKSPESNKNSLIKANKNVKTAEAQDESTKIKPANMLKVSEHDIKSNKVPKKPSAKVNDKKSSENNKISLTKANLENVKNTSSIRKKLGIQKWPPTRSNDKRKPENYNKLLLTKPIRNIPVVKARFAHTGAKQTSDNKTEIKQIPEDRISPLIYHIYESVRNAPFARDKLAGYLQHDLANMRERNWPSAMTADFFSSSENKPQGKQMVFDYKPFMPTPSLLKELGVSVSTKLNDERSAENSEIIEYSKEEKEKIPENTEKKRRKSKSAKHIKSRYLNKSKSSTPKTERSISPTESLKSAKMKNSKSFISKGHKSRKDSYVPDEEKSQSPTTSVCKKTSTTSTHIIRVKNMSNSVWRRTYLKPSENPTLKAKYKKIESDYSPTNSYYQNKIKLQARKIVNDTKVNNNYDMKVIREKITEKMQSIAKLSNVMNKNILTNQRSSVMQYNKPAVKPAPITSIRPPGASPRLPRPAKPATFPMNTVKRFPLQIKGTHVITKPVNPYHSTTYSHLALDKRIPVALMEKFHEIVKIVNKAKAQRRTYTIIGLYYPLRKALIDRGWIEKTWISRRFRYYNYKPLELWSFSKLIYGLDNPDYKDDYRRAIISKLLVDHQIDYLWDMLLESEPFRFLSNKIKRTVVNRYPENGTDLFATKIGLSNTLRYNAQWFYIKGLSHIQYPRTYNLACSCESKEFIQDFRITSAVSLLFWVQSAADKELMSPDGEIELSVFMFALLQSYIFLRLKEHKDIDGSLHETTDEDWNMYLDSYYKITHFVTNFRETDRVTRMLMINMSRLILKRLARYLHHIRSDGFMNLWILKPHNDNQGHGVRVCRTLKYVMDRLRNSKVKYIIQKYIERPLLIYNTKFDIRQWFLMAHIPNLHIWMYKDCCLRFSSQLYDTKKLHESIHLTNVAIQCKYKNCDRHPALPAQNLWHSDTFKKFLSENGQTDVWRKISVGMKESFIGVILCSQERMSHRINSFELFGADFMVNEDYHTYVLEINCKPGIEDSHDIKAKPIIATMMQDLVKVTVDYFRNPKASTGNWQLVYRENSIHKIKDATLAVQGKKLLKKRAVPTIKPDTETEVIPRHSVETALRSFIDHSEKNLQYGIKRILQMLENKKTNMRRNKKQNIDPRSQEFDQMIRDMFKVMESEMIGASKSEKFPFNISYKS